MLFYIATYLLDYIRDFPRVCTYTILELLSTEVAKNHAT